MSLESGYTATLAIQRPSGRIEVVFETWDGGDVDGPDTKHRNPITRRETARGGKRTRTNVVLTREADAEMWAIRGDLEDAANIDPAIAVRQMVDARDTAIGSPKQVTGKIKSVKYPKYDLSGDAVGMVEVEVSADE